MFVEIVLAIVVSAVIFSFLGLMFVWDAELGPFLLIFAIVLPLMIKYLDNDAEETKDVAATMIKEVNIQSPSPYKSVELIDTSINQQ